MHGFRIKSHSKMQLNILNPFPFLFLLMIYFQQTHSQILRNSTNSLNHLRSVKQEQLKLLEKLEEIYGENFLKDSEHTTYSTTFARIENDNEYIDNLDSDTDSDSNSDTVTKYPILIPDEDDIVTEPVGSPNLIPPLKEEQELISNFSNFPNFAQTKTIGRIDSSYHFKRTCGDLKEKCPAKNNNFREVTTSKYDDGGLTRPRFINYMNEPHYCRCEEDCGQFGDCCWTIAKTLLYKNEWRCHKVQHENMWALMISKCSDSYKADKNASFVFIKSCESPQSLHPTAYTFLHDLPVYSSDPNRKGLFRNIYCAKCNSIESQSIYKTQVHLRCSKKFDSEEKEAFISRAQYQKGKRIWVETSASEGSTTEDINGMNFTAPATCGIFAAELDPRLLLMNFPETRFCRRNSVDKCPREFAQKNPVVGALCNSYTQNVVSRQGFVFKNPHCAQCFGLDARWDLRCLKDQPLNFSKTGGRLGPPRILKPGQVGAQLDSAGLSFLFDFDLTSEGNFVGYESKCTGDTIWDFLRQKCTPIQCPKGFWFDSLDGKCKTSPIELGSQPENGHGSPGQNIPEPMNTPNTTVSTSTPCYVIVVHESEYTLLPNASIIINQSLSDSASTSTLIFHPDEYSYWNSTSISICAQSLSSSFSSRFSPFLNSLSLVTLSISLFFSTLHLNLFLLLPKMRNLPGKNLFCLTLSLVVSQLIFVFFITSEIQSICIIAAVAMHYFFLTSFFWMNIMSFDIWRTFSNEYMMSHHSQDKNKLFLKYSLWGWLIPLLILVISTSIDFYFESNALKKVKPLYGHNNLCWIGQGLSLFLFFALPAVIIILLNIVLFTCTARAILKQSRESEKVFSRNTGKADKSGDVECNSRKSEAEVVRMKLYIKLGLIMGVTWILGFLSGISGWEWLWYPFVVVNGLQGTFIFFAFDCKKKVWEMVKERFGYDRLSEQKEVDGRDSKGGRRGTEVTTINTNTITSRFHRRDTTTTSGNDNYDLPV